MPLKARDVESALKKKGFKEAEKDHHYFYLYHQGKKTAIRTKISHGEKDIHDQNCGFMSKQMKLNRKQFDKFVECDLTEELYVQLLIDAQHLDGDPSQK